MSVHKLPDGRFICKFPAGTIPGSPKKTKEYFGRGEAGEIAALARNAELGVGTGKKVSTPSFSNLALQYFEAKSPGMTDATVKSLDYKMGNVIIPEIGQVMAHEMTHSVLDSFVSARKASGVKNRTIRDDLTYIRAVMNFAMQRGLIVSNPVAGYALPRDDSDRIRPPNRAEFDAILTHAPPHTRRAMLTALYTGARPGPKELYSLQWRQVDFFNRTITIISAEKGGLDTREIPIASKFMELLKQWKTEDDEAGVRHGYIIHFRGSKVSSIRKGWETAMRKAGITRRIRRYDLRHMVASELLAAGVDIVTVSRILGHKSPMQTMTTYMHVGDPQKKDAMDRL